MEAHLQERYADETRRLVLRRSLLGTAIFICGVGLGAVLEYFYNPDRLSYLLVFLSAELVVCGAMIAGLRSRRLRRSGLEMMLGAAIALLFFNALYGSLAGTNPTAMALLFVVFELTAPLLFPWGGRRQAILAFACSLFYGVFVYRTYAGGEAGAEATPPVSYALYAVAAAGAISVLGAAFLNRQRFSLFVQREQLDRHLAAFRNLTRAFDEFDPQRVVFLSCILTLDTFHLDRLWVVWRSPGGNAVLGYLVRRQGQAVGWQALADAQPLWSWAARWGGSREPFVAPADDPDVPASLRSAHVGSLLCIPLRSEGESLGAICADREGEPLMLGERELALASVLAGGTGIALANARLYQQVAAASAEKSLFLARIAHELRNPLQAIRWDIDAIEGAPEVPRERIERLRQNTLATVAMASELQEFAEIETRRLAASQEPLSLPQTIDNLLATAMALLEGRPIAVHAQVAADAEVLVSDPLRLRQILGNLISNAAKFTERGAIEIDARRAGREIAIRVRDTGAGIKDADLTAIFTPFYRGSARVHAGPRGMGLGLAIAHELAAILGGRIEVESAPGQGSTFSLFLPANGEAEGAARSALAGAVVAVIEDDESYRELVAAALGRSGATVVEAGDGAQGLRRVRERRPDAIVLDLGLSGLGGLEVLGEIKRDRRLAGVPVVVATAEADPQLEAQCRAAGCAAYVIKPYTPDELLRVLLPLLERGKQPPQRAAGGATAG